MRGTKLRVVFDTNILVSALVFPGGRGEDALRRIIEERDELVLSKPIIDELLSELALTVKPRRRLHVVQDEPDNRILECAIAGRVDAVVTGDRALLKLREYRGVGILSLREYLDGAAGNET